MTDDQAQEILRGFRAAYPSATLSADTVELWMHLLAPLDYRLATDAMASHLRECMFFPTPAEFNERLEAAQRIQRINEAALATLRCDGSGWLAATPPRPCPTCSPAASKIFADDELLASYRRGRPLHEVLQMTREEFRQQFARPACIPPTRAHPVGRSEPAVSFAQGKQAAVEAYADECRRQGREPNWHFFDSVFTRSTL